MTRKQLQGAVSAAIIACMAPGMALAPTAGFAQVPEPIYKELVRIGKIVDVSCTAKLYRPLMPQNDYNTWWPPGAAAPDPSKAKLYPGVTITRDMQFGPHDKDLVDIFMKDGAPRNRPVFIYVAGGGGNKIEQQIREANAFYDNIGRWGTNNGFVVVTVQRHPVRNWDDGGRNIAMAVDWVKANISRWGGDGNNIVMAAHSAGTFPTGQYVGHPERWLNGVQIKGMIYISGNPIPTILPPQPRPANAPALPAPGSTCGSNANMASNEGMIAGPSGYTPAPPPAGGPGGPPPLTDAQRAERDNLPGFKKTPVKLMLVRAELDPGVEGDMLPADTAIHDALCATEGRGARDGQGRCPVMFYAKRHSHVSEVFSFDTPDTTFSGPILAFAKSVTK